MKRVFLGLGTTLVLSVGVVGILHAPFARSALMKVGGCPVGKASAADIETVRKQAVSSMRGVGTATTRPALGFVLEGSTPDDVRSWAHENGVTCTEKREGLYLSCRDVPAKALRDRDPNDGDVGELSLAFRPTDRKLVNITASTMGLGPDAAAARMNRRVEKLTTTLGAPTQAAGDVSANRFAKGGYATSKVSYRFGNYIAEVTATSFDQRGVHLMEHYVIAND